jgi:hypothetical protein
MGEVAVAVAVPGPEDAVLALWDDPARWPAFVDGFRVLVRADPDWPAPGTRVVWTTGPHGAGQTREVSVSPGVRSVETEQMTGTLTAAYADGHLHVTLAYELKERTVYTFFFVRRALRDALRRTAERYAIERRADAELAG